MNGAPKIKNVSRDVTTPLSGTVCRPSAGINLYTKYEVSMFTHYEDMKGDEKCKKWGWFGVLGVTQGHRKHRHLISYNFLFDFNRNYACILYRFRVIAHFSSKVANFNPPHLHLSPT